MEYGFSPRLGNEEIVIKVNLLALPDACRESLPPSRANIAANAQRAVFDSRQPRATRN